MLIAETWLQYNVFCYSWSIQLQRRWVVRLMLSSSELSTNRSYCIWGRGEGQPGRVLEYFWKVDNIFFISKKYIPMDKHCPMYCNTHILNPALINFSFFLLDSGGGGGGREIVRGLSDLLLTCNTSMIQTYIVL